MHAEGTGNCYRIEDSWESSRPHGQNWATPPEEELPEDLKESPFKHNPADDLA